MVLLTQTVLVPDPSESKYWCISMATLLLGSVMAPKTAPFPEETHVQAPVYEVPSELHEKLRLYEFLSTGEYLRQG